MNGELHRQKYELKSWSEKLDFDRFLDSHIKDYRPPFYGMTQILPHIQLNFKGIFDGK
jgi:hypothetical protein